MLWVQDQTWPSNALLPRTPTSGNNSLSAAGVSFTPPKFWPGSLVTSEKKAVSTILDQTTVTYIRKGYGPCSPRREKTYTKLFKIEKVHHLFPLTRWATSCFFVWPEDVWRSTIWPAIHSQTRHPLALEGCSRVKIRYMVPVVSPHTALGVAGDLWPKMRVLPSHRHGQSYKVFLFLAQCRQPLPKSSGWLLQM